MPTVNLSDRKLRSLKTEAGQQDFFDSGFSGGSFGVRVGPTSKTFFVAYRNLQGEKKRHTLGRYDRGMSLDDARKAARAALTKVDEGEDPAADLQAYKAAETFEELADQFKARHLSQRKPATRYEYTRIIDKELLPSWEGWKIQDIKRKHVIAVLDGIESRGKKVLANRVRAVASKMFNYAVTKDLIEANPVHLTVKSIDERKRKRTRILSDKEIKKFWAKCDELSKPMGCLFQLCLVLGQRIGETSSMRWSDIEKDKWIIPAEIAKNGVRHVVPLPPLALEILEKLEKKSAFVFTSPRNNTSMKWVAKANDRLNDACKLNEKSIFKDRFTPHDLRRTCGTGMGQLRVSREIIGAVLNHKDQSVTARYDLYDRVDEKKAALAKWSKYIERVLADKGDQKVVNIR